MFGIEDFNRLAYTHHLIMCNINGIMYNLRFNLAYDSLNLYPELVLIEQHFECIALIYHQVNNHHYIGCKHHYCQYLNN